MKGLLLKELYILKGKQYLLILAFLLIWAISTKSFSFIIVYVALIGSQIAMSTMAADEAVSFSRYALTMPIDRKMLIKTKYMLFLGLERLLSSSSRKPSSISNTHMGACTYP